jgi:hypothetical protein
MTVKLTVTWFQEPWKPGDGGGGGGGASVQGLKTKVTGNRVAISGQVQPPAPDRSVVLKLFANGSPLRQVARAKAPLNDESRFKRRFRVPFSLTRCKVRVGFEGQTIAQKRFGC